MVSMVVEKLNGYVLRDPGHVTCNRPIQECISKLLPVTDTFT